MNTKTYEATTMADALAEVKRDLGRDAVILNTRSVRRGGLFGLGGRSVWEITAAANADVPERITGRYVAEPREESASHKPLVVPATTPSSSQHNLATPTGQEITEIRQMVKALLAMQGGRDAVAPTEELDTLRRQLVRQDVAEEIAAELIGELHTATGESDAGDQPALRASLAELLAARIPTAPPTAGSDTDAARVIALIGPTGVGKTTTIAKMAANYKLRRNQRVGLITIDTYRIAAVDQLRTYADIIDVPLKVVLSAGEIHEAVQSMRDMDVVLIDTAGRSQNDRVRVNQLRGFLAATRADEVHLAVSAAAGKSCIRGTLERFLPLGVNRVILTKLDEAGTFGTILNVAVAARTALSFVTTGQDVPDDIAPADAKQLAELILEGRLYGSC